MTNADLLAALGGTPAAYVAADPGEFISGQAVYLSADVTRAAGNPAPMGPKHYIVKLAEMDMILTGVNAGKPMDKAGNPADGDDVVTDPTRSPWFYTIQDPRTFELIHRVHQSDLLDATDAESAETASVPNQWAGQP